jgi:hypothetical protein
MMIIGCCINVFGSITSVLFGAGIYFNHPFYFALGSTGVCDTLWFAFSNLPLSVLVIKLVPERIESSLFAVSTGLVNLAYLFIGPNLGNLINLLFFHISTSNNNLNQVWKLYIV